MQLSHNRCSALVGSVKFIPCQRSETFPWLDCPIRRELTTASGRTDAAAQRAIYRASPTRANKWPGSHRWAIARSNQRMLKPAAHNAACSASPTAPFSQASPARQFPADQGYPTRGRLVFSAMSDMGSQQRCEVGLAIYYFVRPSCSLFNPRLVASLRYQFCPPTLVSLKFVMAAADGNSAQSGSGTCPPSL